LQRDQFTWKQGADLLAACSRLQAEKHEAIKSSVSPGHAAEYRRWEKMFKGCAGAEYKLDKDDMEYFGLPFVNQRQQSEVMQGLKYSEL